MSEETKNNGFDPIDEEGSDMAQKIHDAERNRGLESKKSKKRSAKKASGKKKKWIIIAILCVIVLIAAIFAVRAFMPKSDEEGTVTEITANPTIGSIRLSVTGSGTIEPYERYDIVPLVTGKILSSPFEEGDYVEEDQLLYEIDHEDMDISITKAQNSLKKAQKNNETYYENLENSTLYSPGTGVLSGFNLKAGDRVSENQTIASIQDTSKMIATVAFNAAQWEKISVGDTAELYLFPSMYTCTGTVTKKSYISYTDASGALLYDVEITADNPGSVSSNTTVTATVTAMGERLSSPVSGTIRFPDPVSVKAKVSGEVAQVFVTDGQTIKEGDLVLKIDDEDIRDSLERALLDYSDQELSLESTMKRMEDYNITAPISGTVITKNYKAGDTISSGGQGSSNVLMVVADMSKMKFTFSADETDINKIEIGQTVEVTADAVEDTVYIGEVTKIASEGTPSNGVTYFEVEVVISEPEGLRPGMNVSAEIYYQDSVNVLVLPVSAVRQIQGESYVYVKGTPSVDSSTLVIPTASPEATPQATSAAQSDEQLSESSESGGRPSFAGGQRPDGATFSGGQRPDGTTAEGGQRMMRAEAAESTPTPAPTQSAEPKNADESETEETDEEAQEGEESGTRAGRTPYEIAQAQAPEGTTTVRVITGATDGTYIEIIAGLTEEDTVVLIETNSPQSPVSGTATQSQMMGMGGMGNVSVSMPAGGMGGFSGGGSTRMSGGGFSGGMMGR